MLRPAFFMFFLIASFPAAAEEECAAAYESIVNLSKPEYASSPVWNGVFGRTDREEKFSSAFALDNGGVLAAGESQAADGSDRALYIAEADDHGRLVWEKTHKIPDFQSLRKITKNPEGFVALGEKKTSSGKPEVWLGFFDRRGELRASKIIRPAKGALFARDIIAISQGGYLLAAASEEAPGRSHYPALYKLDAKGRPIDRVALVSGPDSEILTLSPGGPGHYNAAGYVRGDDGRRNGWLISLNRDLSIAWERQYPRGSGAQFNAVREYGKAYIVAAGETVPYGEGNRAAWIMLAARDSGEILWQRYYTGRAHYSGRGVLVSDEGVISLLIGAARPEKSEEEETARLLGLDPRGGIILSDEFPNAQGARALNLALGANGERIIAGNTTTVRSAEPVDEKDQKAGPPSPREAVKAPVQEMRRSADGWVMAATPVKRYEDSCMKVTAEIP